MVGDAVVLDRKVLPRERYLAPDSGFLVIINCELPRFLGLVLGTSGRCFGFVVMACDAVVWERKDLPGGYYRAPDS